MTEWMKICISRLTISIKNNVCSQRRVQIIHPSFSPPLPSLLPEVPTGPPSHGGDVTVYVRHKPTELAHSFLFCSCVYFSLYGPFNCTSFHKFSRQLSAFSLCSSGLIFSLLVLSTLSIYLYESLFQLWYNPLWLTGLKALTDWLNSPRVYAETEVEVPLHRELRAIKSSPCDAWNWSEYWSACFACCHKLSPVNFCHPSSFSLAFPLWLTSNTEIDVCHGKRIRLYSQFDEFRLVLSWLSSLTWRRISGNRGFHTEICFVISSQLLVSALSPVNHKGSHQGWKQTSVYLTC